MKPIKLGLAGFGTVGSGVAKVLAGSQDLIVRRTGRRIDIKTILVRDLAKPRAYDAGAEVDITIDPARLYEDPDIDIVVELMGGIQAAAGLIEASLRAGKHVVTANKALLAEQGQPLFDLADELGMGLLYEASIAGAIPIVEVLRDSLAANRVTKIVGILNGTANYILSEMSQKGIDFDQALAQAKALGYAEADPTLDIEGVDAAHKLALLVRLAYGCRYPFDKLSVRGVSGVEAVDIRLAESFGYRIKLIGQARVVGQLSAGSQPDLSAESGLIEAGVFPALVKQSYLLAQVPGNFNAVRVESSAAGPILITGQGAGDTPTASAVLADVMNLARRLGNGQQACEGFAWGNTGYVDPLPEAHVQDPDDTVSEHYFRFTAADEPGVMAAIAGVMADLSISIAQAVQHAPAEGSPEGSPVPIVFTTHHASMGLVRKAIERIDAFGCMAAPTVHYRIF